MDPNKIKIISKDQLFELMENKEDFKLVEVLAEEDYASGHLPMAINIPVDKIEKLAPILLSDKEQRIVVYCSGYLCTASPGAARKLQSMGYTDVFDYKAGKEDWRRSELPLAK